MGAGDVKLLGAAGAWLGPAGVFHAFVFTALLGAIYAFILLAWCGHLYSFLSHYQMVIKKFILSGKINKASLSYGEKLSGMSYGVAIALGSFSSAVQSLFN